MYKFKKIVQKILSLISLVIFIVTCIYSVQAYSFSIGLFDDVEIQISGNDYINSQRIKSAIFPQMTSSLLSVNLTDIQKKLETMNYIETVQVSRILPHTLMIHIVERSPMLLMNKAEDEITFMDKNGVLLPADEQSIGTFPVPVLSILVDNDTMYNHIGNIAQFFQYLLDEYPLFYKNLSEVKIKADVWEFYSDNNTKIYANTTYLINQINILKNFERTVHPIRELQDYLYIDLRVKDQVIVKEKFRKG